MKFPFVLVGRLAPAIALLMLPSASSAQITCTAIDMASLPAALSSGVTLQSYAGLGPFTAGGPPGASCATIPPNAQRGFAGVGNDGVVTFSAPITVMYVLAFNVQLPGDELVVSPAATISPAGCGAYQKLVFATPTTQVSIQDTSGGGGSGYSFYVADCVAPPPSPPTVHIIDGGDEVLTPAEVAAGVTADIGIPANAAAGDVLSVDTDGDGVDDHTIVLTGADIGSTVTITVDPADIPGGNATLTVTAFISNGAGSASAEVSDTTQVVYPIPDGGCLAIDMASLPTTLSTGVTLVSYSGLGPFTGGGPPGASCATVPPNAQRAFAGVGNDGVVTFSAPISEMYLLQFNVQNPGDELVVSPAASVTPAGCGQYVKLSFATPTMQVTIKDISSGGGSGYSFYVADCVGKPTSAPTVAINDGGDELLSTAEIAAGVTADIGIPADASAGDTLEVDTNGDGLADHTIALTAADIGGTVQVTIAPAHIPANGTLTVTATVINGAGTSPQASDSTQTDSTAPGAPTVWISDGGDEQLTAAEIAAGVTAGIAIPGDAAAGDILSVDTDGDSVDDHTIALTAPDIGATVTITVEPADIPASNGTLTVSAHITDAAGNAGADGSDTSQVVYAIPDGGCLAIDMASLPATLSTGVTLLSYAGQGPFTAGGPPGASCATIPPNAQRGFAGVGSDGVLTFSAPITEMFLLQFNVQNPGDELVVAPAATVGPAGCGPYVKLTFAAPTTQVTISDVSSGGGSGYSFYVADCVGTPTGAPTVAINDGGDELLSTAEIAAGVTADIGIPADASAGDTLEVDTNGDGLADHTIALTAADIGGTVQVTIAPAHIPANGTLTVTATVINGAGTSPQASDSTQTDSTAPGAPTVWISDGGDEQLTAAEIAAGVTAGIAIPGDAAAGDILSVDTDGDSVDDHTIALTAPDIGATVTITVEPADIPASNGTLTVSAHITDAAGNTGADGSDTTQVVYAIPDGGCLAIDMASLPATLSTGVTLLSYAGDGPYTEGGPPGASCATIPPNAQRGFAGVGNDAVLTFSAPITEMFLLQFNVQNPGDELVVAPAATVGPAGCGPYVKLTFAAPTTQVTISDVDPGGGSGYSFYVADCTGTATSAPTVTIDDGGDELLSAAEIAAGVTADIDIPGDAAPGDTLEVDTNGDGAADHTIALTGADVGGTVTVTIDPAHIPADGTLSVAATVTNSAGTSPEGSDSTQTDSTATGAPTVLINDGGDGALSAAEIGAGVTADIGIPGGAAAGDVLSVDTDGDGDDDHTIVLTAADIGATITITVEAGDVPATNGTLTVTAQITDAAGNPSAQGADSTTTGSTTGMGGCVAYDMGALPTVLPTGTTLLSYSGQGPFYDSLPSSSGCSTVPAGAARGFAGVGNPGMLVFDEPISELWILQFHDQDGDDLNVSPSATITPAGCGSYYHVVLDAPSATVDVEDLDGGGGSGYSFMLAHCTDESAPTAPTVTIEDGGDGLLSADEIAAGVTVTIGVPADAAAGDTLSVDTDDDDSADQTITLEDADVASTVVLDVDPAHVPEAGTLTVAAWITDMAGNESDAGTDSASTDSTGPTAPTVTIHDGDDGVLSAEEQDAGVTVDVGIPDDAATGDVLDVYTDNDDTADQTITLAPEDIGAAVQITVDADHFPEAFATLTVRATITDSAGNIGPAGEDTSLIGCTAKSEVEGCCGGVDKNCDDSDESTLDTCDPVTFECVYAPTDVGSTGHDDTTGGDGDAVGSDDTSGGTGDAGTDAGSSGGGDAQGATGGGTTGEPTNDRTGGEESGGCSTSPTGTSTPVALVLGLMLALYWRRRVTLTTAPRRR